MARGQGRHPPAHSPAERKEGVVAILAQGRWFERPAPATMVSNPGVRVRARDQAALPAGPPFEPHYQSAELCVYTALALTRDVVGDAPQGDRRLEASEGHCDPLPQGDRRTFASRYHQGPFLLLHTAGRGTPTTGRS